MPEKNKPYSGVADIYDHLMSFINYKDWAEYYYYLTKDRINKNDKILEIAAGNCNLAIHLRNYYSNIVVSDISKEMLKKCSNNEFSKVCCNMNYLPFKTKFACVLSAFDSLNYLLTKKALSNLFAQIYDLLEDKGIFTFDVSLENNSLKNLRYLNRKRKYNGIRYTQTSSYDKEKKIHTNKFLLMYPDGKEREEIHTQKIYPVDVVFKLLLDNGFYVENCFDAFSFKDASEKSNRVQFVAIKNKSNAGTK